MAPRESVEAEAYQEEAERGDHGNHAEICARQQPGQHDRADHLRCEVQTLGEYRSRRTSHGEAPQFAAFSHRAEGATGVIPFLLGRAARRRRW